MKFRDEILRVPSDPHENVEVLIATDHDVGIHVRLCSDSAHHLSCADGSTEDEAWDLLAGRWERLAVAMRQRAKELRTK